MAQDPRLLGTWIADVSDPVTRQKYGRASIEFRSDGRCVYTLHGQKSSQLILLEYQADGKVITTNQPSAPREERTLYELPQEDYLILNFGGVRSRFIRS